MRPKLNHYLKLQKDYAFFLLDLEGNVQTWNLGAQRIKGYTENEIIGKNFCQFYLPEDLSNDVPNQILKNATEKGKSLVEGWRLRKDGSKFWASVLITAIYNDEGEIISFGKLTRDLTDKKIIQETTEKYCLELSGMLNMVSHEIRGPITRCQGLINVLNDTTETNLEDLRIMANGLTKSISEIDSFTKELTLHIHQLKQKYNLSL